MPLASKLQKFSTASPLVASYDWADVANGFGYIEFYPAITDNSTTDYLLLTKPLATKTKMYARQNNNTTFTFDSSVFNSPRTVKGIAIVSGALYAANTTATITAHFYKYSGGETSISSDVGTASYTPTVNSDTNYLFNVPLTETNFAAGDNLRVKITFTAGTNAVHFGISPDGSNDAASAILFNDVSPQLKIQVPFKIEV